MVRILFYSAESVQIDGFRTGRRCANVIQAVLRLSLGWMNLGSHYMGEIQCVRVSIQMVTFEHLHEGLVCRGFNGNRHIQEHKLISSTGGRVH